MGLSAGLWSSVSGLLSHGEKMNVIGNNIANVNTIGFKGQRMDFEDFMYQDGYSAGGPTQIGRGVGVNAVLGDFSQAAFETTNDPMDMAIGGKGFFQVRDQYSEQVWYTRAGNFRFDREGYLRLPGGQTLQGWKIDNSNAPTIATGANPVQNVNAAIQGSGVPTDVRLDTWTVPPKQTTKVELSVQLSTASGNDKTSSDVNPLFALSSRWKGTQPPSPPDSPPLSSDAYAYQTSLKVYDEGGTSHTLTTYFDMVDPTKVQNLPNGNKMYEYIVTMDPSEDQRTYGGKYDPVTGTLVDDPASPLKKFSEGPAGGILMKGTITFNSAGQIVNQTAYTYMGNTTVPPDTVVSADPNLDTSWQPAAVSSNGQPVFSANFTGHPLANTSRQSTLLSKPAAQDYLIEFDLGLKCTGNLSDPWGAGPPVTPPAVSPSIANAMGSAGPPPVLADYNNLANFVNSEKKAGATSANGNLLKGVTQSMLQDGYTSGALTNTTVDREGVISGIYSNGVTLPLYQITLYDFVDKQALRREGGNLYAATRESGNPQISAAKQGGMGEVNSYSIEQSNVDMAREFVQMITTQRGFQANSKGVTTVDTMLEVVINMKR